MSSKNVSLLGIAVGSLGIFLGFYFYFQPNLPLATASVTVSTVGIIGLLGFIRHVFLQKDDAKRMGWESERPDWQYEVGFANLAFGIVGLWAVLGSAGLGAQGAILAGYGLYLLQAGLWNSYRSLVGAQKSAARLINSGLSTTLISLMMLFFAWAALIQ